MDVPTSFRPPMMFGKNSFAKLVRSLDQDEQLPLAVVANEQVVRSSPSSDFVCRTGFRERLRLILRPTVLARTNRGPGTIYSETIESFINEWDIASQKPNFEVAFALGLIRN